MDALTVNEYKEAYNKVVSFIEAKPSKRSFLKKILVFGTLDEVILVRRSNIQVNLSEQFHARYVRTDTIGLNLIDAV